VAFQYCFAPAGDFYRIGIMTGPPVPFSKLPLNKEVPDTKLNAWGAYGKDDEKGFLNRQTDEIVKKAAESEIKTGKRYFGSLITPAATDRDPSMPFPPQPLHVLIAHNCVSARTPVRYAR
jgi:hypothetical protein